MNTIIFGTINILFILKLPAKLSFIINTPRYIYLYMTTTGYCHIDIHDEYQ